MKLTLFSIWWMNNREISSFSDGTDEISSTNLATLSSWFWGPDVDIYDETYAPPSWRHCSVDTMVFLVISLTASLPFDLMRRFKCTCDQFLVDLDLQMSRGKAIINFSLQISRLLFCLRDPTIRFWNLNQN